MEGHEDKDVFDVRAEAEEERKVIMKELFAPLKAWYRKHEKSFSSNGFEDFPMFWQELEEWDGYKSVYKGYLASLERHAAKSREKVEDEGGGKQRGRKRERSHKHKDKSKGDGDPLPKRKTRWSKESAIVVPVPPGLAPMQQQTFILRMCLEEINRKLLTVAQDAKLAETDNNRSPSPEPQYDGQGKRTNTREIRMREKLMAKRSKLVEDLLTINPGFNMPAGAAFPLNCDFYLCSCLLSFEDVARQKLRRKLYIPLKEYPTYNFIGLIIG
jgi:splicing factor 1